MPFTIDIREDSITRGAFRSHSRLAGGRLRSDTRCHACGFKLNVHRASGGAAPRARIEDMDSRIHCWSHIKCPAPVNGWHASGDSDVISAGRWLWLKARLINLSRRPCRFTHPFWNGDVTRFTPPVSITFAPESVRRDAAETETRHDIRCRLCGFMRRQHIWHPDGRCTCPDLLAPHSREQAEWRIRARQFIMRIARTQDIHDPVNWPGVPAAPAPTRGARARQRTADRATRRARRVAEVERRQGLGICACAYCVRVGE